MKTPEEADDYLGSYQIVIDLTVHKGHACPVMVNAERAYMAAAREIRKQIRAQERLLKELSDPKSSPPEEKALDSPHSSKD